MNTIEVDFEVLKALFNKRATESVTYNDVLREILGLKLGPRTSAATSILTSSSNDWISKGVRFPVGTEFRAKHKGQVYFGKVEAGALLIQGRSFRSPSEAAVFITNNSVNGWTFWEARRPGEENWRTLKSFRFISK